MPPRARAAPADLLPHSWDIEHWPENVYPHSAARGKYLVRTYRDEFLREGVVSRVGRELVFLGSRYNRWLEKRAAFVSGYDLAANRKERTDRPAP